MATAPDAADARSVVDFFLCLFIAAALVRTFVAEPYFVPTGSMAPALLGWHKETRCPHCRARVVVGSDGASGSNAVCGNCSRLVPLDELPVAAGDRLLVQKGSFDYVGPRRWETVVFRNPDSPNEAYVKRVAGLPGETVRIVDGDVFVDGAIARKSLDELLSLVTPVFEATTPALAAERFGPLYAVGPWTVDAAGALRFTPPPAPGDADLLYNIAYHHRGRL
ncbi:MAG: S26 family signal peptidase, partial [Planctomycetia bacterium]